GVVDPVHRDLVDAQPVLLGEQQQFGVEEPFLVLDLRQQCLNDLGAGRLETALGVGEAGRQRGVQQREMTSRLGPRTTAEPRDSRLPMARSLWPEISGATSGRNASRSVDRST